MKTKKLQLEVNSPMGNFLSDKADYSEEVFEHFEKLLEAVCEGGKYFQFKSNGQRIFLPRKMIQKSIFKINVFEEDED